MGLDESKEIVSQIPYAYLIPFTAFLLTMLSLLLSGVFLFARASIVKQIKRFIDQHNAFATDIDGLKTAMRDHATVLENYKRDFYHDLDLNKDTIVSVFNDAREKTFDRINELNTVSSQIQIKTANLSEVFRANSEILEIKLNAFMDHRNEVKECFGKVKLMDNDIVRMRSAIVKVIDIVNKKTRAK